MVVAIIITCCLKRWITSGRKLPRRGIIPIRLEKFSSNSSTENEENEGNEDVSTQTKKRQIIFLSFKIQ